MLLIEWERAVKEAEADFQNTVTKTPGSIKFVDRTLWLTRAILRYGGRQVYRVACVFYSSDALDKVPGINGCNRHRVLVDWIGDNIGTFGKALEMVDEAMSKARITTLQVIAAQLNKPMKGR